MSIAAYVIRPSATTWTDLKTITLDGRLVNGRLEYRFSMYKVLKCEAIEAMRFDLESAVKKRDDGKLPKTSGFLVWDDACQKAQPKANKLLNLLGLPLRGPVILVAGKRILGNTLQYEFESISDTDLVPNKMKAIEESIKLEWLARSTRRLPVLELAKHEHAWEWHQQCNDLVERFHAKLAELEDPNNFSCGACHSKSDKLSRCGSCRLVVYCSRECQKRHWKEHIIFCTSVRTLREKRRNQ